MLRTGLLKEAFTRQSDKGYDAEKCRAGLRKRGIRSRIARKGQESSERLGRQRWVVERTLAWLARYRRLAVRYGQRADIHEAFLRLGCSLVCLNYL
jgi:transposase